MTVQNRKPVVVRGGGDLATGTIWMLVRAGYPVVVLESANPTAIRRKAAFSEAVFLGEKTVEGISCLLAEDPDQAAAIAARGKAALLVDPEGNAIKSLKPDIVIDAIIAKRNMGTSRDMAPLTIGLGPGFTAGVDVDYVVETMRGHHLGRVIEEGSAMPNTGVPGVIAGHAGDRVIHAPASGVISLLHDIGDVVEEGETLAIIKKGAEEVPVPASLTGVLRGILRDGFAVPKGMKMADIDPRKSEVENCTTISDKARCIAGSVLMLVVAFENQKKGL